MRCEMFKLFSDGSLTPGMEALMDGFQPGAVHVGIDLSGGNIGMA